VVADFAPFAAAFLEKPPLTRCIAPPLPPKPIGFLGKGTKPGDTNSIGGLPLTDSPRFALLVKYRRVKINYRSLVY
ncbi:MAG TPA: hypothetical protein VLA21_10180, partial [Candidatus Limnocylindria bacterium]|nr:hypothetical protein [Candidatus Limnocylindria bacterium]